MNYPIAMIPYANMAPYAAAGPPESCYFVACTPRNSIQALQSGAVWAAAVPVGGLAALGEVVEPVGLFGIAAHKEVMSVMFFSDRPFDGFCRPQNVRLSDESASSVRLLYLLMGYQCGFDRIAAKATPGAAANGDLVIGDTALHWLHLWEVQGEVKGYRFVTDLAAQWDLRHGLPFVFARWAVRADAPQRLKDNLRRWLDRFAAQEDALIDRSTPDVASRLGLSQDYIRRYQKVIRRCLTSQDAAGQALFQEEWRAHAAAAEVAWFQGLPGSAAPGGHVHG
jgi:predicted solute-binding protein